MLGQVINIFISAECVNTDGPERCLCRWDVNKENKELCPEMSRMFEVSIH